MAAQHPIGALSANEMKCLENSIPANAVEEFGTGLRAVNARRQWVGANEADRHLNDSSTVVIVAATVVVTATILASTFSAGWTCTGPNWLGA